MNKVLLSVIVLIMSVLVSIIGIILYSVGDLSSIPIPTVSSWMVIVLSGFVVVFGFLVGIRYMSTL